MLEIGLPEFALNISILRRSLVQRTGGVPHCVFQHAVYTPEHVCSSSMTLTSNALFCLIRVVIYLVFEQRRRKQLRWFREKVSTINKLIWIILQNFLLTYIRHRLVCLKYTLNAQIRKEISNRISLFSPVRYTFYGSQIQ